MVVLMSLLYGHTYYGDIDVSAVWTHYDGIDVCCMDTHTMVILCLCCMDTHTMVILCLCCMDTHTVVVLTSLLYGHTYYGDIDVSAVWTHIL